MKKPGFAEEGKGFRAFPKLFSPLFPVSVLGCV
jgi:hypothetical protein